MGNYFLLGVGKNFYFILFLFLFSRFEKKLGFVEKESKYKPNFLLKDDSIKQISTSFAHSLILKENGDVIGFGSNECFQLLENDDISMIPTTILSKSNVIRIFCGEKISFFLNKDGSLFSYGGYISNDFKNQILIPNHSVKFINQTDRCEWTPESHHLFSESFKISVFRFVCCLKVLNKNFDFKVPKYLIFMIVKSMII